MKGGEVLSRTSSEVKNRYNAKVYDQLAIRVPKGRRAEIEAFTREHGESINGMVNRLIQAEMGLSDDEWGGEPKMRTLAQIRRILNKDGYRLVKRERGQDSWMIVEANRNVIVAGDPFGMTTEQLQEWVNEED